MSKLEQKSKQFIFADVWDAGLQTQSLSPARPYSLLCPFGKHAQRANQGRGALHYGWALTEILIMSLNKLDCAWARIKSWNWKWDKLVFSDFHPPYTSTMSAMSELGWAAKGYWCLNACCVRGRLTAERTPLW